MALPRKNRLRRRQDFNFVYQKGKRRRSKHLTLIALRRQPNFIPATSDEVRANLAKVPVLATQVLVGISISQKVSKRAVVRNRIKRQIRAIMRSLLPSCSCGWKLVIVVQPQAIQCDYFQFLQELEQLLSEAEVLNGYQ